MGPKMVTGASQPGDPAASTFASGSSAASEPRFDISPPNVKLQPISEVEGGMNVGGSGRGATAGTIRELQLVREPVETLYPPISVATGEGSSGSSLSDKLQLREAGPSTL